MRVFTGGISTLMLALSGTVLFKLATKRVDDPVNFDNEVVAGYQGDQSITSLPHYVFWIAGLIASCYLVGFLISIAAFFVAFLLIKARASVLRTTVLTGSAVVFMATLAHLMVLDLPRGLLQDAMHLPWPIN